MATSAKSELLFSSESMEVIDFFKGIIAEKLRKLAKEKAISEGRNLVTGEDVVRSVEGMVGFPLLDTDPSAE